MCFFTQFSIIYSNPPFTIFIWYHNKRGVFFLGKHVTFFPHFFMSPRFSCPLLGGFSAHGFCHGFLFPVKELGLLTNPGHWVRVLDVVGSYMYIVL
jgi:hypothetical protein